jgi:NAD(P)H-flavin reductase
MKLLSIGCLATITLVTNQVVQTFAFSTPASKQNVAFSAKSTSFRQKSEHNDNTSFNKIFGWNQQQQRGFQPLFMGWGPDPIWTSSKVVSNMSGSPSGQFVEVTVDVPQDVMEGYKVPGQYVQLKENDSEDSKPLFLAIASPPSTDGTKMEFLIKKTDNNDWITSAAEAKEVVISQVMGGGFAMEENFEGFQYDFPCQNVLLFANGSGIAPLRAAIESSQLKIAQPGTGGRTARLYFGVTSPADMPYADKFEEWEKSGVEVVPVISRPEECEWAGRTGYVQNTLEEDGVPIPRNTGALLCGVKGMAESVKDLLAKAGT